MTPKQLDATLRPWLCSSICSSWHGDPSGIHPLDPEQCRLLASHISGNLSMVLVGMLDGVRLEMEGVGEQAVTAWSLDNHRQAHMVRVAAADARITELPIDALAGGKLDRARSGK